MQRSHVLMRGAGQSLSSTLSKSMDRCEGNYLRLSWDVWTISYNINNYIIIIIISIIISAVIRYSCTMEPRVRSSNSPKPKRYSGIFRERSSIRSWVLWYFVLDKQLKY